MRFILLIKLYRSACGKYSTPAYLLFLTCLLSGVCNCLHAQTANANRKIDSMTSLLSIVPDSVKMKICDDIANGYARSGEEAERYANQELELAEKLKSKHYILSSLHTLGNIGCNESDWNKAMTNYLKEINALQSYGADSSKMLAAFAGLGNVYLGQGDNDKALKYFLCALNVLSKKEKPSLQFKGFLYQEIAAAYTCKNNYDKALEYYLLELPIWTVMKEGTGYELGKNYQGLGDVYYYKKNYAEALKNFNLALTEFRKTSNPYEVTAEIDNNIGNCCLGENKYNEANSYFNAAIGMIRGTQSNGVLAESYKGLSEANAKKGAYRQAYDYHLKYTELEDTIENVESRNHLNDMEAKYETANKDKELAEKDAQIQKQAAESKTKDAENKKQQAVLALFVFMTLAIAVIAIIILRSLRISRKQRSLIERQKQEVEKQKGLVDEKNKDILDSITYAKRLQEAILPPVSLIRNYFPDSFVLYKPKDIVAGDFYWITPLPSETGGVLMAAADCTGHGVPGAMVSVVCSNALNRAVKEFHITEPGKLLDKVRELVLETFSQKNVMGDKQQEIKDGMDISLLSFTPTRGTLPPPISWSGAYNPLWFTAPLSHESGIEVKLVEIAGDKQPVGKSDNPKPFTTHTITLPSFGGAKGGCFYLFTDGFADQFGGPKGKKFKYKQMQELILTAAAKPMEEQGRIITAALERWKGGLEQVDDILLIGIRI